MQSDQDPDAGMRSAAFAAAAVLVAGTACFLAGRALAVPAPLLAVAAGLGFGRLGRRPAWRAAFGFWSGAGLKSGVALLGLQVVWTQIAGLGLQTLAATAALVFGGIAGGAALGVAAGLTLVEALIAASAVSICGASAAVAAAGVLPCDERARATTAKVIVAVNLLSTAAVFLYPPVAQALSFDAVQSGVFLGLSIHDVAQVVAAGEVVSAETAATAAVAKLGRVLMLAPAVMVVGFVGARLVGGRGRQAYLAPPLFVCGFAAFVVVRSTGLVPQGVTQVAGILSSIALLAGVMGLTARMAPGDLLTLPRALIVPLVVTTLGVAAAGAWIAASAV